MNHPEQVRVRKKEKSWKDAAKAEEPHNDADVLSAAGFVRCPECQIVFLMANWDCPACGWTRP